MWCTMMDAPPSHFAVSPSLAAMHLARFIKHGCLGCFGCFYEYIVELQTVRLQPLAARQLAHCPLAGVENEDTTKIFSQSQPTDFLGKKTAKTMTVSHLSRRYFI